MVSRGSWSSKEPLLCASLHSALLLRPQAISLSAENIEVFLKNRKTFFFLIREELRCCSPLIWEKWLLFPSLSGQSTLGHWWKIGEEIGGKQRQEKCIEGGRAAVRTAAMPLKEMVSRTVWPLLNIAGLLMCVCPVHWG